MSPPILQRTQVMSEEMLLPELFDYIIDFLHDDQAALRACALVSRSWVPTSRIHLFHHLGLTGSACNNVCSGWAPNTGCRRIHGTLVSSPHLTGYINKLSVNETNIHQPPNYRWVSGEIMFPSLLKKLRSLKELEFNFPAPGSHDSKTIWSTMVFKDISDAMNTLTLESFTLRQFTFTSLADFVKVLESWRNLKTLQLDDVDVFTTMQLSTSALENTLDVQIPVPTQKLELEQKASLQHLLLRSNSSALFIPSLLHARSPLKLTSLTSLIINITSDNYGNVLELLKCTPNLETLEIEIETSFDYEAHLETRGTLDLHVHPALNKISLQISLLLGRIEPMSWIIPSFSSTAAGNIISDLSIICVMGKPLPTHTVQEHDNSLAKWKTFDDLLSQPTFSALKRFRLDFALESPIRDEGLEQISNEYIKQLPSLSGKGVLETHVSLLTSA